MASKRKAESYDKSDPFIASDDDSTSKARPVKKIKNTQSGHNRSGSAGVMEARKDEEGNQYWELSGTRRVTISDFKGKKLVSIREFYEKDGKKLPGKKGISMTIDQYTTLLNILPAIEEVLTASGETIPRPRYGGDPITKSNDHDDSDSSSSDDGRHGKKVSAKKANFEATSDEDED